MEQLFSSSLTLTLAQPNYNVQAPENLLYIYVHLYRCTQFYVHCLSHMTRSQPPPLNSSPLAHDRSTKLVNLVITVPFSADDYGICARISD